jgi:hypothetical protein
VKPASLEWECIPDPASHYEITLWNAHALPWQDPASQKITGDHERQLCSSHSRRWLVYAQWKLEGLLISPLKTSLFLIFFLLILVSSLPGDPQALDCDLFMHSTWVGSVVTKTLVFHTYYSCAGTVVGSCTTYSVCSLDGQYICFNPIYCSQEQWLEVQNFTSTGELISQTQVYNP